MAETPRRDLRTGIRDQWRRILRSYSSSSPRSTTKAAPTRHSTTPLLFSGTPSSSLTAAATTASSTITAVATPSAANLLTFSLLPAAEAEEEVLSSSTSPSSPPPTASISSTTLAPSQPTSQPRKHKMSNSPDYRLTSGNGFTPLRAAPPTPPRPKKKRPNNDWRPVPWPKPKPIPPIVFMPTTSFGDLPSSSSSDFFSRIIPSHSNLLPKVAKPGKKDVDKKRSRKGKEIDRRPYFPPSPPKLLEDDDDDKNEFKWFRVSPVDTFCHCGCGRVASGSSSSRGNGGDGGGGDISSDMLLDIISSPEMKMSSSNSEETVQLSPVPRSAMEDALGLRMYYDSIQEEDGGSMSDDQENQEKAEEGPSDLRKFFMAWKAPGAKKEEKGGGGAREGWRGLSRTAPGALV
ncbi:hypothetical protein QBC47DRAFT_393355, partial [Echria macrotheca]